MKLFEYFTDELKNYVRKEIFDGHVKDDNLVRAIVFGMVGMILVAFFGAVITFFIQSR